MPSHAASLSTAALCLVFALALLLPSETQGASVQNTIGVTEMLLQRYALGLPVDFNVELELAAERMNAKRFRGQGGWTLNSVGYNGGLGALQKLFNKRGEDDMGDKVVSGLSAALDTDDLISDFVQFLKLRESGLLGPEMLRCVIQRLQDEPTAM